MPEPAPGPVDSNAVFAKTNIRVLNQLLKNNYIVSREDHLHRIY
jgi:hypothetical protein